MGRPRKVKPQDVQAAVDALVADYQREGILPTDFRLMEGLGICDGELDGYYLRCFDPAASRDGYVRQLRRLIQFRRQICVENLAAGKQATGWIFLSKQQRWGGMRDAQKNEGGKAEPVEILLCGANGKPLKLEP